MNEQVVARAERHFYLPQLDGLRFAAFLLVFAHHFPNPTFLTFPLPFLTDMAMRIHEFGWVGVDLFFCLSSFLITTLLFAEQSVNGSVSLNRFYARRALRIWPLYFLVITLVFFALPIFSYLGPTLGSPEWKTLVRQHFIPFIVFLGNFSSACFNSSATAVLGPLWSISVEEQFYLIWPILFSVISTARARTWGWIFSGTLAFTMLVRLYILLNGIHHPMLWLNTLSRLDPFVMGAAVALFRARGLKLLPAWLALPTSLGLLFVVSSFPNIWSGTLHAVWQLFASATACALILVSVLTFQPSRILLGNRVFRWAGKLSYGLYMYHVIGYSISLKIMSWVHSTGTASSFEAAQLVVVSLAITISISASSYYAIERPFLVLKNRFTTISSRPA